MYRIRDVGTGLCLSPSAEGTDLQSCKILTFLIRAAPQHADEEVCYQHSCFALSQHLRSYYLRNNGMLAQSLPNLVLTGRMVPEKSMTDFYLPY